MKKKRLFAAFLAVTVAVSAFAFAGCDNGGDGENGGAGKGIQVDGEQWATEINKFKLDESISNLDSFTVEAETKQVYEGITYSDKVTAYVNCKNKELYIPDSKPTVEDAEYGEGSVSALAYFKLGEKRVANFDDYENYGIMEGTEICDVSQLRYSLNLNVSDAVVATANKETEEYERALREFYTYSGLVLMDTVKIGEQVMPFADAGQYLDYDEANGSYKGTDIGISVAYNTYAVGDMEIRIFNDSFSLVFEDKTSGFTMNLTIYDFNKTTISLSAEERAELDKIK